MTGGHDWGRGVAKWAAVGALGVASAAAISWNVLARPEPLTLDERAPGDTPQLVDREGGARADRAGGRDRAERDQRERGSDGDAIHASDGARVRGDLPALASPAVDSSKAGTPTGTGDIRIPFAPGPTPEELVRGLDAATLLRLAQQRALEEARASALVDATGGASDRDATARDADDRPSIDAAPAREARGLAPASERSPDARPKTAATPSEGARTAERPGDRAAATNASEPRPAAGLTAKININTATAAELELLPGIGPALAQRIIEHRRERGLFRSVDELDQVKGIGPSKLAKIRPLVVCERPSR